MHQTICAECLPVHRALMEQLEAAVQSHSLIGQATGIVMVRYDLDAEHAFDLLRETSMRENIRLRDLAAEIVARRPAGGYRIDSRVADEKIRSAQPDVHRVTQAEFGIVDGRAIVRGECDLGNAREIEQWLDSLGDAVVDVSGVTFFDSSTLRAFLNAARRNTRMRIAEPSAAVMRVLEITGTQHILLDQ